MSVALCRHGNYRELCADEACYLAERRRTRSIADVLNDPRSPVEAPKPPSEPGAMPDADSSSASDTGDVSQNGAKYPDAHDSKATLGDWWLTATHKHCPRCATMRLHADFGRRSTAPLGLGPYCYDCRNGRPKSVARRERAKRRMARRQAKSMALVPGVASLALDPCAYCGDPHPTTHDHIVPFSRGGAHDLSNLARCCRRCNFAKGTRSLLLFLVTRHRAECAKVLA